MLATPGPLPVGSQWSYEVKWDGMRLLVDVSAGGLTMTSRTGRDMTRHFPELAGLADAVEDGVLDGEVVLLADGAPSFEALSHRFHRVPTAAEVAARPVVLMVFDVLRLYGVSLLERPLAERRATLERLELDAVPQVRLSPSYDNGTALWDATRERGLEGIIAKRRDSRYLPGRRSPDWVKVPHRHNQDCVIGGWRPERTHPSRIGGLLLGIPAGGPGTAGGLRFVGRAGSGLAGELTQRTLAPLFAEHAAADPPFGEPLPREDSADARWCRPGLVAAIKHSGWTESGRLRHPVYTGLRTDVDPGDVTAES
jgi:bifunctional non-homologous end joining protein LigD